MVAAAHVPADVQLADGRPAAPGRGPSRGRRCACCRAGADGHAARGAVRVPVRVAGEGAGGGVERLALPVRVDDPDAGEGVAGLRDERGEGRGPRRRRRRSRRRCGRRSSSTSSAKADGTVEMTLPCQPSRSPRTRTSRTTSTTPPVARVVKISNTETSKLTEVPARSRLPGGQADAGGEPQHAVDHVAVGDGDALGLAGGAGGVHHARQLLGVARQFGAGGVGGGQVETVEEDVLGVVRRQYRDGRGVGQDERHGRASSKTAASRWLGYLGSTGRWRRRSSGRRAGRPRGPPTAAATRRPPTRVRLRARPARGPAGRRGRSPRGR